MKLERKNSESVQRQEDATPGLRGLRHLLSHLHGEITVLDATRRRVLLELRQLGFVPTREEVEWNEQSEAWLKRWNQLVDQFSNQGWVDAQALRQEAKQQRVDEDSFFRIQQILRKFESANRGASEPV